MLLTYSSIMARPTVRAQPVFGGPVDIRFTIGTTYSAIARAESMGCVVCQGSWHLVYLGSNEPRIAL